MNARTLRTPRLVIFAIVIICLYQKSYATWNQAGEPPPPAPAATTNLSGGALFPSSAGEWTMLSTPTTSDLSAVFGGAAYSFAVGDNGTLLHYDGFEWVIVPTPTTVSLTGIWGTSPENVFVVGSAGNIFHFDGHGLTKMTPVTSVNLQAVWGSSPEEVFAVGDNGTILRFDGKTWSRDLSGTSSRLRGITVSRHGDAFAVGENGTVLHRDGVEWTTMTTPTTRRLSAVWALDRENVVAVGAAGTVLHYDGRSWRLADTPTTANLNGVWGISATQLYAVGDNGTILEFNGDRWTLARVNTMLSLTSIYNGFAVGGNGAVYRNAALFVEADNLRITELDPWSDRVEVSNMGPPFTAGDFPICHGSICDAGIAAGTVFFAGEVRVFRVPRMDRSGSDVWLYRMMPFSDPNNLIHGVEYGGPGGGGHTAVAVEAGKWTAVDVSTPIPFYGASLAFDGYGYDPKDWYIDETPSFGRPDYTVPGTVERSLYFPAGTQDFESVLLGDEIIAVEDWEILDDSAVRGIFTARVVDDVMGALDPRGTSTRWLRIRDQNPRGLQDEVVTPTISAVGTSDYQWSFYVALEEPPGGDGTGPAIMVQHAVSAFEPVWGIEFRDDAWYLVVTEIGGGVNRARLTTRPPATGQWVHVQIAASFENSTVRAVIDGTNAGELPIDLGARADAGEYRLAYQGGGAANTGTLLLDDVSLEAGPSVTPLFTAFTAQSVGGAAALSWGIGDGELIDGFAVYRRAGDAPEELAAGSLPPEARRYEDNDVVPGTEYRYQIGAVASDGTIVRSHSVMVTIDTAPAVVFGDVNSSARDGAVELTWDIRVTEPIEGFRVYRRSGVMATETDVTGGTLLPGDARRFVDMDVSSGAWYDYRLTAVTVNGAEIRSRSSTIHVPTPPLEVSQVFPNPFRNTTSLEFTLPEAGPVTVRVYDVRGRLVRTLNDGVRPAGTHQITWNGRDDNGSLVSAGTYFFKFETGRVMSTRKVVLVR